MYVDAADDEEVGLSAERREVEANDRQSSLISPDGPATATRREGRSQRGGRRGEVAEGSAARNGRATALRNKEDMAVGSIAL